MYAAGKIPGSFFRREGRPTDQAILTCRLIDRPLRPSFAEGYRNETQVVVTVIGADQENPHDVLAINAASAALMLSGIPFEGPLGAVRIAYTAEGEWIPHPTYQEGDDSAFELVVAGRQLDDGDVAIMMVEAGGTEAAWELYQSGAPKVTEEVIAEGLESAKTWIRESIELQRELVAKAGTRPRSPFVPQRDYGDDVLERVAAVGSDRIEAVTTITVKAERERATDEATAAIVAELAGEFEGREREIKAAVRSLTKKLVRQRIAATGVRIDGRGPADLRPLSAQVGLAPHRPRLGPVPAGRDPGAQRHHPRHAPHGSAARHHRHRREEALHAPLQHAALGQRRGRPGRQPQAPRDRPRPARRAGPAPGRPSASRSSPTPCAWCRRSWPPTARRRWRRCAARRCR